MIKDGRLVGVKQKGGERSREVSSCGLGAWIHKDDCGSTGKSRRALFIVGNELVEKRLE